MALKDIFILKSYLGFILWDNVCLQIAPHTILRGWQKDFPVFINKCTRMNDKSKYSSNSIEIHSKSRLDGCAAHAGTHTQGRKFEIKVRSIIHICSDYVYLTRGTRGKYKLNLHTIQMPESLAIVQPTKQTFSKESVGMCSIKATTILKVKKKYFYFLNKILIE